MHIGLSLGIAPRRARTAVVALPFAINANGWTVSYPSPPAIDPVVNPQVFAVMRQGFNAAGQATTVSDSVTLMKRLRQPYPAQASLSADQVSLSDFIYQGDVIAGAVNNSTRAAPKPVAMWLTRDLTRATSNLLTARLAVAHAHGRNGKPVAAVRFIATDGTTTVEQVVGAMSARQWAASGLYAPYFECSLDISALAQGVLCTLDAIIYPWVGPAFRIGTDADSYPSANLSVLKFLNDRTGAYGTAYAYVDAVSGNNATAVTSATPATAAASPYLTIAAAAAAVQSFNNTNFGRNSASGGVVRLKPGTHARTSFSTVTVTDLPLVIEADSPANKASVIVTDGGVHLNDSLPDKTVWRNLTLRKTGASISIFDTNSTLATMTNMLALENVHVDLNGQTDYEGWFYRLGRIFAEEITGGWPKLFNAFSAHGKHAQLVGCNGAWNASGVHMACAARLTSAKLGSVASQSNTMASKGMFVGHCHLTQLTDAQVLFNHALTVDARGLALVQTVMEQCGGLTGAALAVNADNNTNPVENIIGVGLTVVGARTNILYQDTGTTTIAKSGCWVGCVHRTRNTKSDLFGTQSGARVGNWPAVFQTGMRHNAILRGGDDSVVPGTTGAWAGEVAAPGGQYGTNAAPLNAAWVSDRSFDGTRAGGGDYTPGAGSVLGTLPGGFVHYPVDMLGRVIPTNGTAVIGAIQK